MDDLQHRSLVDALRGVSEESVKLRETMSKTEQAAERAAERASRGAQGATPFGAQGMPGGGGMAGAGMRGAGVMAGAMAGMTMLEKSLGAASRAMDTYRNETLSGAQKLNKFGRDIPLIGGLVGKLQEFEEAMADTVGRIRRADKAFTKATFDRGQRAELTHAQQSGLDDISTAATRADAFRGLTPTKPGTFDRSTLAGEQRFEADSRMLPFKDAENRSGALAGAARRDQRDALTRENETRTRGRGLRSKLEDAEKRQDMAVWGANRLGGKEDRAGRHEAGRAVETAARDLEANKLELAERVAKSREKTLSLAQAESAAIKDGIASQRESLAILDAKAQRIQANSRRLGGMSVMDRQRGLMAARMAKKHGWDKVAPEIRGLAETVAPDWANKEKDKFGETTAEHKALKNEGFFGDDKESVKDIRGEQAKAKAEITVNMILDESALADKVFEAFKDGFGRVIADIEAKQKAQESNRKAGEQIKHANER